MDEYYLVAAGEYDIGFPWKRFDVQSEPISEPVSHAAYNELGFRVLAANGSHNR